MGISPKQLDQDGAVGGGVLRWNEVEEEWQVYSPESVNPVKTYTWFQDTAKPYIEFKGLQWTVQDRVRFAGTDRRTPSSIKIVCEVDNSKVGNFRIVEATSGQIVVEKLNIQNYSWGVIDLGAISNLSTAETIWEIQIKTSGAQDSIRVSSMDIEF